MNRQRRIQRGNWLGRLLDAAQRRFRRARPGSVLVMVVALLVMLALIGTAAMSTARIDRISSVQHVANTEIDMLAESVKQMVIGQLVNDLFSARGPNQQDSPFSDPDFFKETQDAILGARVPERQLLAANLPDPMNQSSPLKNSYVWRSIGYPAIQNGNPFRFDVPTEDSSSSTADYGLYFPKPGMVPTSVLINGELMPALQAVDLDGKFMNFIQTPDMTTKQPYRAGQAAFLAADTDGDGIADAVLFKLPVSPIAGVTYYAGTRVIDNGSAINLNTAWNPNYEIAKDVKTRTGQTNVSLAGVYPGSVMLESLLSPSTRFDPKESPLTEMMKVDNQRVYANRKQSTTSLNFDGSLKPVSDNGTVRGDFMFLTWGEMLHNQLGRRLDYSGPIVDPLGGGNVLMGKGTRPFGIGDDMALAYRFTLLNSGSQDSAVEKVLFDSTVNNNPRTTPYLPNALQTQAWFTDNFDYRQSNPTIGDQSTNPATLLRSLFTTANPVGNGVVRHTPDNMHAFQYLPFPPVGTPFVPTNGVYPTKTNLNTAEFSELWRGFYDVMCATDNNSAFDFGQDDDIYQGMGFDSTSFQPTANQQHQARMFRSPMRPIGTTNTPRLHPYQVMALRAAIAAANVIALREDDDTHVPFFDIILPQAPQKSPAPGNTPFFTQASATVFGIKRQPFITEVFLNNNPEKQFPAPDPPDPANPQPQNPSGFAAIEIHNPYDTDMNIGEWKLGLIDRRAVTQWSDPQMNIVDLPDNNPAWTHQLGDPIPANGAGYTPFVFPPNFTIPPHGFVVISNYPTTTPAPDYPPAASNDPDAAHYLPADLNDPTATKNIFKVETPNTKVLYLKTLHYILNKEVVLLRPVKAVPPNSPPGTLPQVVRWAPIDSFDCTGIAHQVASTVAGQTTQSAEEWHYVRANDPAAGKAWHFVYPGRYSTRNSGKPTQQGTEVPSLPWTDPANTPDPWAPNGPPITKSHFGYLDGANSRDATAGVNTSFPIQIANADFDIQFKDANNKPTFPLHGFLRAGDLMEATYIGSYSIWGVSTTAPDPTKLAPAINPPALNGPFAELNGLSIDAAFAEDTDPDDDRPSTTTGQPLEDIGRFMPLFTFDGTLLFDLNSKHYVGNVLKVPSDPDTLIKDVRLTQPNNFWNGYDVVVYNGDQSPTSPWTVQCKSVNGSSYDPAMKIGSLTVNSAFNPPLKGGERYEIRYYRYGWAEHVMDYFTTINAPADDYLPNTLLLTHDPVRNAPGTPTQVNRTDPTSTEDNVPSEGLININSAGWKVLASLPMVLDPTGKVDSDKNERLARQIVYYRDVDEIPRPATGNPPPHPHGPFRSPMELLLVPNFMNAMGTLNANSAGPLQGDFSTMNSPADDHVAGDFEKKFLALNRISNLITTRSDSFTAYIQVQGWRDAGTNQAKLVAQRRLAFIVDRSRVTAVKKTPAVYNVPTAN